MADANHFDVLTQGVKAWNLWRTQNRAVKKPDLSKADLSKTDLTRAELPSAVLSGANLSGARLLRANLSSADLTGTNLARADLSEANLEHAMLVEANLPVSNLSGAHLFGADLSKANLTKAYLSEADLSATNLSEANLSMANLTFANLSRAELSATKLYRANLSEAYLHFAKLSNANLEYSILVRASLIGSTLSNCRIYGVSAWDLRIVETKQENHIINRGEADPLFTVDDIEVAQFIYLLLKNEKLRNVIETMTSKAVLILGNFAPERKLVLQAIKDRLRYHGYLPILFDFESSQKQRFKDTITTVARLSRFVIADLTQPRSVTAELEAIVEDLPMLPIQLLALESEELPHAFIHDLVVSDSVLDLHRYASSQDVLASFDEAILAPALKKRDELEMKRLRAIEKKLGVR